MQVVRMGLCFIPKLRRISIQYFTIKFAVSRFCVEGFVFFFIRLRKYSLVLKQPHLDMERLPPKVRFRWQNSQQ